MHQFSNPSQCIIASTSAKLPTTASTFHCLNCFGHVMYVPLTITYQNIEYLKQRFWMLIFKTSYYSYIYSCAKLLMPPSIFHRLMLESRFKAKILDADLQDRLPLLIYLSLCKTQLSLVNICLVASFLSCVVTYKKKLCYTIKWYEFWMFQMKKKSFVIKLWSLTNNFSYHDLFVS